MKDRYTEEELVEFRGLLEAKLKEANEDLELLKSTIDQNPNTESLSQSEGESALSMEEVRQLFGRQQKYIRLLQDALVRTTNGIYGVCVVSGRLISPERLRLVPHATLSIAPKEQK